MEAVTENPARTERKILTATRKQYRYAEKRKILEFAENNGVKSAASRYNTSPCNIFHWRRQRQEIMEGDPNRTGKRGRRENPNPGNENLPPAPKKLRIREKVVTSSTSHQLQYTRRTFGEKLRIVEYAEQNGVKAATRQFNAPDASIRYWMREKAFLASADPSSYAIRSGRHHVLETQLHLWITEMTSENVIPSGRQICEEALRRAAVLGIQDFKASTGWLLRFKHRWNLHNGQTEGFNSIDDDDNIDDLFQDALAFMQELEAQTQHPVLDWTQFYQSPENFTTTTAVP